MASQISEPSEKKTKMFDKKKTKRTNQKTIRRVGDRKITFDVINIKW